MRRIGAFEAGHREALRRYGVKLAEHLPFEAAAHTAYNKWTVPTVPVYPQDDSRLNEALRKRAPGKKILPDVTPSFNLGTHRVSGTFPTDPATLEAVRMSLQGEPSYATKQFARFTVPEILAHEIGHAQNEKHWLSRFAQGDLAHAMYRYAPETGLVLGGAFNDEQLSPHAAAALAAGAAVPNLGAEGMASWRGYALMKRLGANRAQLARARGNLLQALSTYAVAPAIAAASAYGARGVRNWATDRYQNPAI